VAGKPNRPAIDLITRHLGPVAVMVGDRPETDGALARGLGARFGLVRSGVVGPGVTVTPTPDYDAADLRALVASVLG
jgi:ribonucleotide monophosphatase NagD (HAD superfamily)